MFSKTGRATLKLKRGHSDGKGPVALDALNRPTRHAKGFCDLVNAKTLL